MNYGLETSQAVAARCAALGLSLSQALGLAKGDATGDVVHVLGLDSATLTPLKPKRWLWMAAQTSSVSYQRVLTEENLLTCLTTGEAPTEVSVPIGHFLNETPMVLVVMAVEEAAQRTGIPISQLWHNLHQLLLRGEANASSWGWSHESSSWRLHLSDQTEPTTSSFG